MTAAAKRLKHKAELRREILDAARDIFVTAGYENFSMRKLAGKIEYSPGSLYLHFKNKEELFDSLVEESFAHLLEVLTALENGPKSPVRELKRGLRAYVDFGLRNPNEYRFAFMLRPPVTTGTSSACWPTPGCVSANSPRSASAGSTSRVGA